MSHDILNLETCYCHTAYIFGKSHEPLRAMIVGGRSLAWHMEDLAALLGLDDEDGFLDKLRNNRRVGVWRRHFPSREDPMRLEVMEFVDIGGMCDLLQYARDSGKLTPDEAKDWHFFLDGFMIMQLRKSQGCGTAHLLFSTR